MSAAARLCVGLALLAVFTLGVIAAHAATSPLAHLTPVLGGGQ